MLVDASDEDEPTTAKRKKGGAKRKKPSVSQSEPNLTKDQEEKLVDSLKAEYWIHEDCACYSPGVYLDSRGNLRGLEDAIREAAKHTCTVCSQAGATIPCVARHCTTVLHIHCAHKSKATVDESNFSLLCGRHKSPTKQVSFSSVA